MATFIFDKEKKRLINLDAIESISVIPEEIWSSEESKFILNGKYDINAYSESNSGSYVLGVFDSEAEAWEWARFNLPNIHEIMDIPF